MAERIVPVINQLGLHARAAAKVVHLASGYPCEVRILFGGQEVDAKSILGILLLAAPFGSEVVVRCDGDGEDEAVAAIADLFAERFGEGS